MGNAEGNSLFSREDNFVLYQPYICNYMFAISESVENMRVEGTSGYCISGHKAYEYQNYYIFVETKLSKHKCNLC